MKNLSLSLIRRLHFHRFKPIPPLLRLNSISDAAPSSSSPSSFLLSSPRQISTHSKTYPPLVNHFWVNPCRNLNTHADEPPEIPSIDQEKLDLEEAFESATTTSEMVRLFKQMELSFQGNELGLSALKLGLHLDRQGDDPETVLSYAEKALRSFDAALTGGDNNNKPNLLVAMALQLMGSANYGLKRFSDGLGYLNRANRILVKLESEPDCNVEDVRPVLHAVQLELANVKNAMGRREEAIENLKKSLEIKEMAFKEGMGQANRGLADAYVAVLNFDEALPYAVKALEIHKKELGSNSAEVAQDRRLLGVIYSGLERHEEALEQNRLSRRVLKNWGMKAELVRAEIDAANMKVALGKYEEAVEVLKGVVEETDEGSEMRGMVFISMSKALVNQQKFADSKKCLELACEILEKKEASSSSLVEVAEAYSEVAMQYESMNEFETAISLLQKTLGILEKLPQEQHSEGSVSARIGWLLLFSGRVSQAVPYLESAAERLKESFGAKHFGVGYVYNNLGAAYLELGRPQSAAQMFAVAKDVMDVSLGPNHVDSIDACQNLSKAYAGMGNYSLAVEFQQQVIRAWDNHGDSAKDEMKEAKRLFEELRLKARGGVSTDKLPTKALPLPKK